MLKNLTSALFAAALGASLLTTPALAFDEFWEVREGQNLDITGHWEVDILANDKFRAHAVMNQPAGALSYNIRGSYDRTSLTGTRGDGCVYQAARAGDQLLRGTVHCPGGASGGLVIRDQ